jgi:hypothetical protein
MRMTRIPKGADLVLNPVSGAPGFWIDNVIVMAGVPSIMQAMLDEVGPKLKTGIRMLSETVRADVRESDIGTQLGEIAKANPGVTIGSHPFFDRSMGPIPTSCCAPATHKSSSAPSARWRTCCSGCREPNRAAPEGSCRVARRLSNTQPLSPAGRTRCCFMRTTGPSPASKPRRRKYVRF